MRLTTVIASVFVTAILSVSAQTSDNNNADSGELLAELAELPECAVSPSATIDWPRRNEPTKLMLSFIRSRRLA